MRYRKKPVVVEAFKFGTDSMPDWFVDKVSENKVILHAESEAYRAPLTHCTIETLEGIHVCDLGDFVIKGVKNELYPCKPDIFEMTYEAVEG